MSISEFEIRKCEKAAESFMVKRRPPVSVRKELDLGYRIKGQSVELFEIRPQWDNKEIIIEIPIAKSTYVKTRKLWKVFWQRQDLKWHSYEPQPTVRNIEDFFDVVDRDEYACFFG